MDVCLYKWMYASEIPCMYIYDVVYVMYVTSSYACMSNHHMHVWESSRPGSECACAPRACELWKCMSPSSISRLARFCRQLSYCVPVQVPTPREESHDVRAWARVRATRTRLRTRYLLRIVGTVKDLLIVAAVDCIRARAQRKLAAHQYP